MDSATARVLVIDDNPTNLRVLFDLLTERGMHVLISQDGTRGIERARAARPDVILLDIHMPEVDGYEICRQLRSDPLTSETPILFTTAYTDTASKLEGFAAGANDYITKPLHAEEVIARIDVHVSNARLKAELAAQNAELTRLVQAERDAAEFKRRFFAMATHEFRSPLMTIQLAASMIRRYGNEMASDEREEECRTIEKKVAEVNETLTSVLGYVREHTGETALQGTPVVDLDEAIRRIVERFQSQGGGDSARSISYVFEGPSEMAAVDPELLEHVLGNLLANAIKFSPVAAPIDVTAHLEDHQLHVGVRDRGRGIPEHDIHTLFEPFVRSSNVSDIPGTGLGLSVVRQLLERSGGEISVESTLGVGSTFSFVLPMPGPENATARET
ncbi:MAG: ATP-binding protein [Spirochaetales bacterium]